MNNQARSCNLKCKYNVQGICNIYGECIAKDLFIAELEKIKTEILDYSLFDSGDASPERAFEVMQDLSIDIIDNHISELKGESE